MAPPSFTTQKLRRWKRFRPENLPLALPDISSKAMEGMYFYFGGTATNHESLLEDVCYKLINFLYLHCVNIRNTLRKM